MHTDSILPTRKLESLRLAVGTTDSESSICGRLALANKTPWTIAPTAEANGGSLQKEPRGQLAGTVCQPVLHWLTYG